MNFSQKENESPTIYTDLRNSFAGGKNSYENMIKSPSEILSPTSAFGSPKPGTSRVIDALQSTIDELKEELQETKQKYDDHKTKHGSIKKRYDQVVEQLANTKHENDMINALLERKQRRITDLEDKLSETINNTEDYKFNLTNLEVRCKKLQESERIATSEFERMKIAYETVVTSQKEYRDYYSKEISLLKDQLAVYIEERNKQLQNTQQSVDRTDKDIATNVKKMTDLAYSLEQQYAAKNATIVETLKSLALAAKSHGQDTQLIINQCNLVFNELKVRFDLDVKKLIDNYKDKEVDNTIEKLLGIDMGPSARSKSSLSKDSVESDLLKDKTSIEPNNAVESSSNSPSVTESNHPGNNPSEGLVLQKKRNSIRKPKVANRSSSGGPFKEQENVDPKKYDRRSVSGVVTNNKRHSRKVSLTKSIDFSEFEKGSKNRQNKRNSVSNDMLNLDWRAAKPVMDQRRVYSVNKSIEEDEESEEGSDVSDTEKNSTANGIDSSGKKKRRRRRRKRKSQRPGLGEPNDDEELDQINNLIQNGLSLSTESQ